MRPVVRLFTTEYPEPDSTRRRELAECLRRNIACESIDQICMLAEGGERSMDHAKVVVRTVDQRPHYDDYLRWIREVADRRDVSLIANADICFDRSIEVLRSWPLSDNSALALARWDLSPSGKPSLNYRNDSQDAWGFRGTPRAICGNYPIGVPRCDNRFLKELELAGYEVLNPSFSLRSYHLHEGSRSGYPAEVQEGFVDPPYGYSWPGNLMPLHRTIWHNFRNRALPLDWRFDKRRWAGKLKLHWVGIR